MAYFVATTAYSTAGVKTIPVGFQPVGMRITVAQRYNTNDNFAHQSVGISNGTKTYCTSIFQDTSGGVTVSSAKLISHYERMGGTIMEVLAANFDSFTASQVKFNITTPNVSYNLLIEVWG